MYMNNMRKLMALFESDLTNADKSFLDYSLRIKNKSYLSNIRHICYFIAEDIVETANELSRIRDLYNTYDEFMLDTTQVAKAGFEDQLNKMILIFTSPNGMKDTILFGMTFYDLMKANNITIEEFRNDLRICLGLTDFVKLSSKKINEGFYDKMFRIINIRNDKDIDTSGSSLQGKVTEYYSKLLETFGDPTYEGDFDDNFTAMWCLEFETQSKDFATNEYIYNTIKATIYNWNREDVKWGEKTIWHVGGFAKDHPFEVVKQALYPPHPIKYLEDD